MRNWERKIAGMGISVRMKSPKKVAELFGFHYDSTYELARPWDGCVKTIESCIMTREEYESKFRIQNS